MIGVDIVVVSRIEKMIEKFGDKALERFLNPKEMQLIKNSTSVAGYWAAKEAASKALGSGISKECSVYDIKISKTKKGAPVLKYSKKIEKKYKIKDTSLSITHDGGFAIAVVAVETK